VRPTAITRKITTTKGVGAGREQVAGLSNTPQVSCERDDDHPQLDRHRVRSQVGHGRGDGIDPGGNRYRDGGDVVGQEPCCRHQAHPSTEVVAGYYRGAGAGRVGAIFTLRADPCGLRTFFGSRPVTHADARQRDDPGLVDAGTRGVRGLARIRLISPTPLRPVHHGRPRECLPAEARHRLVHRRWVTELHPADTKPGDAAETTGRNQ
jgi:hypothetical protein